MARQRMRGFAMVDVLVALLLLAVSLAGASATLIQTMRTTHGALLATRAVDLAADLAEELRSATSMPQSELVLEAWRQRVSAVLPVAGLEPDEFAAIVDVDPIDVPGPTTDASRHVVRLRWRSGSGTQVRELSLPVSLPRHFRTALPTNVVPSPAVIAIESGPDFLPR